MKTTLHKVAPKKEINLRYDQSDCIFKESETNLHLFFNLNDDDSTCGRKIISPRKIKKKEYSEFFENLNIIKPINTKNNRDLKNDDNKNKCSTKDAHKLNNTTFNEIAEEDDIKETKYCPISNNLTPHQPKPFKCNKKETSCLVMYFMPKKKEESKINAFSRFF